MAKATEKLLWPACEESCRRNPSTWRQRRFPNVNRAFQCAVLSQCVRIQPLLVRLVNLTPRKVMESSSALSGFQLRSSVPMDRSVVARFRSGNPGFLAVAVQEFS